MSNCCRAGTCTELGEALTIESEIIASDRPTFAVGDGGNVGVAAIVLTEIGTSVKIGDNGVDCLELHATIWNTSKMRAMRDIFIALTVCHPTREQFAYGAIGSTTVNVVSSPTVLCTETHPRVFFKIHKSRIPMRDGTGMGMPVLRY